MNILIKPLIISVFVLEIFCNFPKESQKLDENEARALSVLLQGSGSGNGSDQDNNGDESGITLGGSVTGLDLNSVLLLQNNFSDLLQVTLNGTFTFQRKYPPDSNYAVTVFKNPEGKVCNVLNGVGKLNTANYFGVVVDCN